MTQTAHDEASVMETLREVIDSASADRVFGTPVSLDGLTVLPVAKVSGGGGGGAGNTPDDTEGGGTGGGMGVAAKPLGVFVIKNGQVGWRPAIDVNRVIVGGQIVAVVALLTIRAWIKARGGKATP